MADTSKDSLVSQSARRQLLVVLGMHRSGTSATTGALQCLGVQLGSSLYAGHQGINPKGYFEHSGIADTNDEALLAMGSSWDDILLRADGWESDSQLEPFAENLIRMLRHETHRAAVFAVKDPRVCRLLPWWLKILSAASIDPVFLFVVRHPTEVHRSLERRDGFSEGKSSLLWLLHYLEAERYSRGCPRAAIDFDSFLASPADELQRVEPLLGIRFPRSIADATSDLGTFISKDLRHHQGSQDGARTASARLALHVHALLKQASDKGCLLPEPTLCDAALHDLKSMLNEFPAAAIEHMRSVAHARGQAQLTVNRLVRSWSWYLGKPVRFLERAFGRMV